MINLSKERPILFNTDMVKAILKGEKTQTRRPIKGLGNNWHVNKLLGCWGLSDEPFIAEGALHWELQTDVDDSRVFETRLPYKTGDILWVRETWCRDDLTPDDVYYKANYTNRELKDLFEDLGLKWKPSIRMPKDAARIFLKVTDVRVERLQDITEADAEKEGIDVDTIINTCVGYTGSAKDAFSILWEQIYKNWDDNPWVWVIEFEKMGWLS